MNGIINYNMGNLQSVKNAFSKLDFQAEVVSDPDKLKDLERVLLPGVGAFGDAMDHLKQNGMDEAIVEFAKSGKPILGICLGMQLLFEKSCEFGEHKGLGLIEGEIVKFDKKAFDTPLKIPHMGWNEIEIKQNQLFKGLNEKFYLYFVHSYHVVCDERFAIGKTHYGYEFVSAVMKENIYGIQPHPEKSHNNGLKIVENFLKVK
ncbi:MAG: imidazole glycerol phosphate synthase subunit HisH [Sulfurospirillum sp.]|nr:MAG: imidazole glycerol phosphate synthase subunit HisH [Sulfurospirillum sp.]